jgi:hypothetical protein
MMRVVEAVAPTCGALGLAKKQQRTSCTMGELLAHKKLQNLICILKCYINLALLLN